MAALGDFAPLVTTGSAIPASPLPLAFVRAIPFDSNTAWVECVYQRQGGGIDTENDLDYRFDGDQETIPVYKDALRYTNGLPDAGGPFFDSFGLPNGDLWKASDEQIKDPKFKPISYPFPVSVHRLYIRRIFSSIITNQDIYNLMGHLNNAQVNLALGGQQFSFAAGTMRCDDIDSSPIFDATTTRFEYVFEFAIRRGGHYRQSPFYYEGTTQPDGSVTGNEWRVQRNVPTHPSANFGVLSGVGL